MFLNKGNSQCKNLTDLRLDIVSNVEPLISCNSKDDMVDICNYRIHYIVINIILLVILVIKH